MSYLAVNGQWWCNTCLTSQEGPAPSGVQESASGTPTGSDDAAIGWFTVSMLGWIIGAAIIAIGVALLFAGWTKTGWTLVGLGVLFGLLGP